MSTTTATAELPRTRTEGNWRPRLVSAELMKLRKRGGLMISALALGVSSTLGSRGITIGIVLGWQIVAVPVLLEIRVLGSLREGLLGAATGRLAPAALFEGPAKVPMSLSAAALVIAVWTVVPLALGAWRTCTRDA